MRIRILMRFFIIVLNNVYVYVVFVAKTGVCQYTGDCAGDGLSDDDDGLTHGDCPVLFFVILAVPVHNVAAASFADVVVEKPLDQATSAQNHTGERVFF